LDALWIVCAAFASALNVTRTISSAMVFSPRKNSV
jgi:hypothetical protein